MRNIGKRLGPSLGKKSGVKREKLVLSASMRSKITDEIEKPDVSKRLVELLSD